MYRHGGGLLSPAPHIRLYKDDRGQHNSQLGFILDHEMTHHLTTTSKRGGPARAPISQYPSLSDSARIRLGSGKNPFYDYSTTPIELDPRIAEVKRQYTHATGKPVNTPEEANRALEWGRRHAEGDSTVRKMSRDPQLRALIIQRMLELVQNTPTQTNKIASVGFLLGQRMKAAAHKGTEPCR